ncbi:hypothetical protein ACQKWADRAFT_310799 [Trichoderma austrokoningii]
MRWDGAPRMTLKWPANKSRYQSFWNRAWVSSVDKAHTDMGPSFFIAQDRGEGLLSQGARDWADYGADGAEHHLTASINPANSSSLSPALGFLCKLPAWVISRVFRIPSQTGPVSYMSCSMAFSLVEEGYGKTGDGSPRRHRALLEDCSALGGPEFVARGP